jgi:hypothetical protein
MLALQIDEALRMIERLELQLDDVPPPNARRLRGATQLLRAAALALQDDSLAVPPIAVSLLKKGGTDHDDHAALILRRLGFWRLGEFDSFCLDIAESTPKGAAGLATVPACVAAQVLYEEGCVDQADTPPA